MKEKIEIPKYCPSCNSTLDRVKDQLFCRNLSCEAIAIKQVLGFIKVLKIKGLGERTVEKLKISNIKDIYTLDKSEVENIIGQKLSDKLFIEIDKSKLTKVSIFLAAFSIPLIGNTSARKVKTNDIDSLTYDVLRKYGLGDKAATNLSKWITEIYPKYKELPITFEEIEKEVVFDTTYSVCVTGKIPGYTKATITTELANLGVKVTSSVIKSTTHLICNDRKGSTKEKKAESLGIPITTFEEFKEMIENVKK